MILIFLQSVRVREFDTRCTDVNGIRVEVVNRCKGADVRLDVRQKQNLFANKVTLVTTGRYTVVRASGGLL